MPSAPLVWSNDEGLGRMVHVYFRREFTLNEHPTEAQLHLFADTNYHLRVNGEFVGFGPARSYPEFPEYDTYDIAPMLRAGENVLAVQVLHVGQASFHNLPVRGGLAAWGAVGTAAVSARPGAVGTAAVSARPGAVGTTAVSARPGAVEAAGSTVDLSTGHDWLCSESAGHDRTTARFSFAIPPVQIFDERRDPPRWDFPARPEGDWKPAVPLADQGGRGELRPRSIPHLTRDEVVPERLLGAYAHRADEEIVSFRLLQESDRTLHRPPPATAFACTYVRSPRAQEVPVGTWWGENYLNGEKLEQLPRRPDQFARTDAVLRLREGWNFLFMSYRMVLGIWEMHLAVPKAAGLDFSADEEERSGAASSSQRRRPDRAASSGQLRRPDRAASSRHVGSPDRAAFLVAGPFHKSEADPILADCPPRSPDSIPKLAASWRREPPNAVPVSPAKALAWCGFGERLPVPAHEVSGLEVPAGRDASFVFDMGREVLGRVFVEFEAPRGTVVDVGYDERLREGRPDYFRNVMVSSGERQVARGGESRLETFFPRGFRYLHVAVHGHEAPVTIRRVGAVSQRYPYEKRGRFECSDPFMNTLWEYGWETLRLCSEDVITDCPWRERTLYGGDLLPETATALATSGDWRLPRRCIEVILQSQSEETGWLQSMAPMRRDREPLFDYQFLTLLNADWYCRWTGDLEFAARAEPVFRRMMQGLVATRDEDGVFVNDVPAFIDWVEITKSNRVCAVNALAARALEAWASLLALLGKREESGEAMRRSREAARVVRERFWDEERGAFADSICDSGGDSVGVSVGEEGLEDSRSVASSAWPMAFGVTTPEQDARLVEHFKRVIEGFDARGERRSTSPYGAFYLLGALYEKGRAGLAEQCIRRLYSDMVTDPTGTVWEHFHTGSSLAHAWSSGPTYYLSTRTLGVRLGFPDRSDLGTILVAPESDTISWARGTVPHPLGLVRVEWEVRGDRLVMDCETPEGARAEVAPRGRLAGLRLFVNGCAR